MPTLADYKAPYPESDNDYQRYVIYLDPKEETTEQEHLKVELLPGKMMSVDEENSYVLDGQIQERTVEGWGYDYYVVDFGEVLDKQTKRAVEPRSGHQYTFVPIDSSGPTIWYNSKLPIVVYVPHGAEVRYRIWYDEVARLQEQGNSLVRDNSMKRDSNAGTLNPTQAAAYPSPTAESNTDHLRALPPGEYTREPYTADAAPTGLQTVAPTSAAYDDRPSTLRSNEVGESPTSAKRRSNTSSPATETSRSVPLPLTSNEISPNRTRTAEAISTSETSVPRSRAVPIQSTEDRSAMSAGSRQAIHSEESPTRSRAVPLSTSEVSATRDRTSSKSPSRRRSSTPSKKEEKARRESRYTDEL